MENEKITQEGNAAAPVHHRSRAFAVARRQVCGILILWFAVRALMLPAALLAGPQNTDFWISGAVAVAVTALVAMFILSGVRALAGIAILAVAVSAIRTVPTLVPYFHAGAGPAAYAGIFLAGQIIQIILLALLFIAPAAKKYFSVLEKRKHKNQEQQQ